VAITNGYATLSQIKTYLSTSSTNDDARLESAIEAASRSIDATCRRTFFSTTATKHFEAEASDYASLPDDLLSATAVSIDLGNRNYIVLPATDYEFEPNETPYTSIHTAPGGINSFPTGRRGMRIAGNWGFCTTGSHPDAINNACLILAVRYFKRRDAAFGVIGTPELGFTRILATDPEVKSLLMPYRKIGVYAC
jgi:hypothetical protein